MISVLTLLPNCRRARERTVSNSREDRLRNDLYCVGWGVKLYSIQSNPRERTVRTTALAMIPTMDAVKPMV